MESSLRDNIIRTAKNRFLEIPKIVNVREFAVQYGWVEVHVADSKKHTLIEFLVSSLRFVEFGKYEEDDNLYFEQDIGKGKFDLISSQEAFKRMEFMRGLLLSNLDKTAEALIPIDMNSLIKYDQIYLIYGDWNNNCIALVSNFQYKCIYFGTSE